MLDYYLECDEEDLAVETAELVHLFEENHDDYQD